MRAPLPLSSRKHWILILPCDAESQGLRHMPFVPQLSSAPAPGCVRAQWGKEGNLRSQAGRTRPHSGEPHRVPQVTALPQHHR